MYLIKHHDMTYGVVEVKFHAFLTSVLHGREWSPSRLGRFTPWERAPVRTRWIGGWVGPRPCLDTCFIT